MDVSIIIPAYNAESTLRPCLLSLLASRFDGAFELIVVDDGSVDGTLESVKDLPVRTLRQKNLGAASAKNAGAAAASAPLIVFADSDILVGADTIARIHGHLKNDDIYHVTGQYSTKPANKKWIHRYKALADYSYFYDLITPKRERGRPIPGAILTGGIEGHKKTFFWSSAASMKGSWERTWSATKCTRC